jgi:hypothetical protein
MGKQIGLTFVTVLMEIFGDLNEGDTLLVRATDEIKAGTVIERKSLSK